MREEGEELRPAPQAISTGAQINCGDLTPCLTYNKEESEWEEPQGETDLLLELKLVLVSRAPV